MPDPLVSQPQPTPSPGSAGAGGAIPPDVLQKIAPYITGETVAILKLFGGEQAAQAALSAVPLTKGTTLMPVPKAALARMGSDEFEKFIMKFMPPQQEEAVPAEGGPAQPPLPGIPSGPQAGPSTTGGVTMPSGSGVPPQPQLPPLPKTGNNPPTV